MRKLLVGMTTVAIVALPLAASAQTNSSQTPMKAQNSGAGVKGKPGSKSGPAIKPNDNTGAAPSNAGDAANTTDAAKIPGKPGSKSGPAVKPPSSSKMK
jgi:hypothetical protein